MSESKTITPIQDADADADAEQSHARAGLNKHIARRQKLLLAGIGSLALIAGSWFLFAGDGDDKAADESGIVTIDTGGLVNRKNRSKRFGSKTAPCAPMGKPPSMRFPLKTRN